MRASSKNNPRELQLAHDTILVPMAILVSGGDIVSLIVQITLKKEIYFTMLTDLSREPTGWVADELFINTAVAKHKFIRLPTKAGAPVITWGNRIEDVRKLENWLSEHRSQ
ncbi:MAG: hypothetical protein Q8P82_00475 [bacterium]|nr:hypothetical protein [bacterium]